MSDSQSCGCGGEGVKKKVLLYACSGGANVAEVSDQAARQLMSAGLGTVFCLAGLGAGIEKMIETARDADLNVIIDGCPMDCAQKIFAQRGLENVAVVRVTDLGIEKAAKGVRAADEDVQKVVSAVKEVLQEG